MFANLMRKRDSIRDNFLKYAIADNKSKINRNLKIIVLKN